MIRKKKRRKKRTPTPTQTPSRSFTDTVFFLGCSENEECRVRGESQTDKKKNTINKYNSKEIKNSLSEKQKLWLITELKHHIHKQPDKTIRRARLIVLYEEKLIY